MSPNAYDLFLNAWSHFLANEDFPKPGTPEWEESKHQMHTYWTKVWIDCENLSKYVEDYRTLCENIKVSNQSETE